MLDPKTLEDFGITRLDLDPSTSTDTDNGNLILDVKGLSISDPKGLEAQINQITGVVTNGLFALRPANVLLLGTAEGIKSFD